MRLRSLVGGLGTLAFVSCSDIDTTRSQPPRGTTGEEVYGIFCDRIGAGSLPEDLTGASFRAICHKTNGQWADTVDQKKLPPITSDAKNLQGKAVTVEKQTQDRARAVGRVESLAKHRDDLIAALDATIPDIKVAVLDTTNKDTKKQCSPKGEAKLGTQVADMLGRFTNLYNDGTVPASTRSLAHLMDAFQSSPEAQQALSRVGTRKGYRPVDVALGAARPMVAYPRLRDLSNATLRLLSVDSDPYSIGTGGVHIPEPGKGNAQFEQMLAVAREEMRASAADPALATLLAAPDPLTGRTVLSRPRDNLEELQVVLYAQDPSFGSGNPRYIVKRDNRGYAAVLRPGGVLPSPFVDKDKDGLPDVDAFGQFVSSTGTAPPSPFFEPDAPDTQFRDAFGRALVSMGGAPVYDTLDTSHAFGASLMQNMRGLVNPDPNAKHETIMYMIGGLYVVSGKRDLGADTLRAYPATGGTVKYNAFHPESSPLVDLVFALGQLMGDPAADDALAYQSMFLKDHTSELARVVGGGLALRDVANKHPEAKIPAASTMWDDLIDVAVKIEKSPGLLEDVLRSLGVDAGARQGEVLGNYMSFHDRISYDRQNLNGPAWNFATSSNAEMKTPVDRTKPQTGWDRSAFHRFLQILHDGNNVTVCNKEGAIVHAKGVPILGSGDICSGALALCSAPFTRPFHECEVFKIDNLDKFYLDSIVGKAVLYMRPGVFRNGIAGIGKANVSMIEASSGMTGFWDPGSSNILHPKPQWLNRLAFFDQAGDSPTPAGKNYVTNHFLADLQGPHIGSAVCPERVIADPDPGAADAAPDGKVHGLRSCSPGDNIDERDQDALFVLENFGGYSALAPLINAFAVHDKEDLFIEAMEAIYRHWPDDKSTECNKTGNAQTNPRYCAQDGAVTYEALLGEGLPGDFIPAMTAFTKTNQTATIPVCTATNAQHQCTTTVNRDGIAINAELVRSLLDPDRAKNVGVAYRKGGTTAIKSDGTMGGPVTPIYLLTGALADIDKAFADFAAAHPVDNQRQIDWRAGRSQLVDQFLSTTGSGPTTQFKDPSIPKIGPTLIDLLRAQTFAHCPDTFGTASPKRCAWARDELANKLADVIKGPTYGGTLDLLDAIRADKDARAELDALLQYLVDAASQNEALPAVLASTSDMMQVMRDDVNLVPLFHVLSETMAPTQWDGTGSQAGKGSARVAVPSMIDAQTTLLARISGKSFDADGTELCGSELDPNQILSQMLSRLVTPTKDAQGRQTKTPIEVIMDVIADLNRIDPQRTDRLDVADYGSVTAGVSDFLTSKERGLEQFYEIIWQGTHK
jgi:hypothetical protein